MLGAGLPRSESEVAAYEMTGYDPQAQAITVHGGKGRKDCSTCVGSGAHAAIND